MAAEKTQASTESSNEPIKNAVQLASEFVVPGGSNLIKGDIKTGGLHLLLGLAAGALLGPIGVLAVGANSYSRATTGQNIYEHFTSAKTAN
ncbi:MAG TPA: DUF6072 family protein [Pyrinomonadaceae bacterium]|jgi:hypothetical protein|nr:DUF6072 family protein [Pyrinomonadaceae bacterium]